MKKVSLTIEEIELYGNYLTKAIVYYENLNYYSEGYGTLTIDENLEKDNKTFKTLKCEGSTGINLSGDS
ncbi:MAG TPA: hypothetical protein PKU94_07740 [Candidatus Hydrothermia bacterium]|nr:hypothetical protein [Candidatus Hydrothermia bacterium]